MQKTTIFGRGLSFLLFHSSLSTFASPFAKITRNSFYNQSLNYFSFKYKDFSKNVGKYVRANHVITDAHWSENWKPNIIG